MKAESLEDWKNCYLRIVEERRILWGKIAILEEQINFYYRWHTELLDYDHSAATISRLQCEIANLEEIINLWNMK